MKILSLTLILFLTACGPAAEMPKFNSPRVENFESHERANFYTLPKSGAVNLPNRLWPEGRWRYNNGLINFRWNAIFKTYNSASPTHDRQGLCSLS